MKKLKRCFTLFSISAIAVAALASCSPGKSNANEALATAESFLGLYYNIDEYLPTPRSQSAIDALEEKWQPYMTDEALETFLLNREVNRLSQAAENTGVTISVTGITFEPIHDEYNYYSYSVAADISKEPDLKQAVFEGEIKIDEDGLVSYFSPEKEPQNTIEESMQAS